MTELDDQILERATSPIIDAPVYLDSEALKPAPPAKSLAERLAAGKPTAEVAQQTNQPKRRGRPPGSKNKTTLEREAREARSPGSSRMVTPPARTKPSDSLTPEQKRQHKLARADKLAETVAETINDNLLLLLMSMGCPVELLYQPGMAPQQVKADSKYTALAQQLTISPMQANIIGRFLAEMEATDTGGKLGSAVTDGKGPLIIYGMLSLASVIQYGRTLADAYSKFEPMLKQYQEYKKQQEQQGFIRDQGTGG